MNMHDADGCVEFETRMSTDLAGARDLFSYHRLRGPV
jgi:hypothetical protein